MREIKDMCEQLLAAPEPPSTPPADLLGLAQASVRRTRRIAGGSIAAVLATLTAITVPLATSQTAPQLGTQPSASASHDQAFARLKDPVLRQMMAALEAVSLPQGYTHLDFSARGSQPADSLQATMYEVEVALTKPSLAGLKPAQMIAGTLSVRRFLEPRDPAFLSNPCRTDRMRELGAGPSSGCEIIDNIAIGTFERSPETRFLIRHVGDWTIIVQHRGDVFSREQLQQVILTPAFEP